MTRLEGRLLVDGALRPGALVLEGERIAAVELEGVADRPDLPVVAPGLIDLHIHGFGLCDPLDDLAGMAAGLARAGTTAFLPTLFPAQPGRLGAHCAALEAARAALPAGGAAALGVHLEGPFVNPAAAGALPPEDLAAPSVEGLRAILGPATGDGRGVRNVTLAPELPGAAELVDELVRTGARVSLGHSRASAAEGRSAVRAGAVGVTHLYNAMTGVHHREMGLAGLALTEDLLYAEIIGDLVHVGREAFELALRARGPEGLCLVSDALAGAGTGCDRFHLHGRDHVIDAGTAYYPPGEGRPERQLAGSAMSQLEMVRRLTGQGVVTLAEALTMAATTPARALGLEGERGVLRAGARADLIVLEGRELRLSEVRIGGAALPAS
jgi:N-acetylglucosamine-6-phosphate deacetylase